MVSLEDAESGVADVVRVGVRDDHGIERGGVARLAAQAVLAGNL
jgi:hypothetical protein